MASDRPNPDALLRRVQAEEERSSRAALKIFFGYAPGVGKTFTMLESALRLKAQGVDVVAGCVETHGRPETAALVAGLEVLPRREVAYRGTALSEFDLDPALARKPRVLLLDELAHTNAPGSRHKKRWQDVLELLEAGIEVHTTLNVQHVESLNDVVAQITYVRVRETVPDSILERADEIELVDLPPDELAQRLREGKVYLPDQARRAADHFFKRGNLLALRELTLRSAAQRIDVDLRAHRLEHDIKTTWPAAERILVCVGASPSSGKVLRGARRMAAGLRAEWVAAYVDAPDAHRATKADRDRLRAHLRLAESMGAEVVRLVGSRVSEEILGYAREHNITRIVIGKPTHARWKDLLKGSIVNQLVRDSDDIEINFISGDDAHRAGNPGSQKAKKRPNWTGIGVAVGLVAAATVGSVLARSVMAQADQVMVYLLIIMLVAYRYGRTPSLVAAGLSVATYDFFLVAPHYTFNIESGRHLLTFSVMFGVGIAISSLTSRLRGQERGARIREARTSALYSLSRELATAKDESAAAKAAAVHSAKAFGGDSAVLVGDAANNLSVKGASRSDLALSEEELAVARWVTEHGRPAGAGTDTLPGARLTCFPIRAEAMTFGALAVVTPSIELLDVEHREFLDAFLRQVALAIERVRFTEEAKVSALRIRTEETRSALLGAVSHDLRTPLGAITGAGTALREDRGKLDPEQRLELCDTICTEAERMERLVGNILDMVRLESGGIVPKREWVPLEDAVGSALSRLEVRLGTREVRVGLPPGLPLLSVDPVLIEQLFVNLFDNVIKHCGPDAPIDVAARVADRTLEIEVADRGPGLLAGTEHQVFDKFYRGPGSRAGGVGLGLSICRGILAAHDGTISAENRPGGGALFRIALPIPESPPAVPTGDPGSTGEEEDT
ncbi:MAG: sensor histidine kinase KdpD [Myxococcota bacterium]|jgi:two-component system sensor histidine kinase KdpD|nr:sensor histidine kinase KdpD [Myxococcota bacterium]